MTYIKGNAFKKLAARIGEEAEHELSFPEYLDLPGACSMWPHYYRMTEENDDLQKTTQSVSEVLKNIARLVCYCAFLDHINCRKKAHN